MARSGLLKARTMNGVALASNSSLDSLEAILRTTAKAFGPPPPNSTDFISSGRIFILKKSSGKSSVTSSRSLLDNKLANDIESVLRSTTHSRKRSLSSGDLTPRLSIPSVNLIKGLSKKAPLRFP